MKRVFHIPGKVHGNSPVVSKWQKKQGLYLATSGQSTKVVNIFDRKGTLVEEIDLPGPCVCLDWDKDGNVLAMIQEKTPDLYLWDANTKQLSQIDTSLKSVLSYCSWSKVGQQLVIGCQKGNVLLYNHQTARKIPILGKHQKKITEGAWNEDSLFCLASLDHTVSLNNLSGETLQKLDLHGDPSCLQFYDPPKNAPQDGGLSDAKVSFVINKQTLYLYNQKDPSSPIELAFQSKYGNIVNYAWFDSGKIMLGFSSGFLVVISTHTSQIGQEIYQNRNHKTRLNDIACCHTLGKAATCGDGMVRIHDLHDLNDVYAMITLDEDRGMLDRLQWSDDGQLLSISTQTGSLYTYLTNLPIVGDACDNRIAHLTSLQEMTVVSGNQQPVKIKLPIEPSIISVGPFHSACAMNNTAWFYANNDKGEPAPISDKPKTYLGSISAMRLNADYAAVLFDGRAQLHLIEGEHAEDDRESRMFPENQSDIISSMALTPNFLIFSTQAGGIHYFLIEDWQFVNDYRHACGIRSLFPDNMGTRLVFIDDKGDSFLYNPVNDTTLEIPEATASVNTYIWDSAPGQKTIVGVDQEQIYSYAYFQDHIKGTHVVKTGVTKRPYGLTPIALNNGTLTCLTQSGKTTTIVLSTHEYLDTKVHINGKPEVLKKGIEANIAIGRLQEAFILASKYNNPDSWKSLGQAALKYLDVENAINIYRAQGDAAKVHALKEIEIVEDRNLLAGNIALLLGDYNTAQELFLKSSSPREALKMHCDLLQWNQALKLAEKLAPAEIPSISREYAQQLEFQGQFSQALNHYKAGVTGAVRDRTQDDVCKAGIARTSLRTGDIRTGVNLANELNQKQLFRDCAIILEALGQLPEAGVMFEKGEQFDKAASIFIRTKNWSKVGELLKDITSPKLHAQYAKAREADGSYLEAAQAYEMAKDYLSVIRINLDHLRNPDEAVRVVKQTNSIEGAKMVARFFQKLGDFASAIQFLVMSQCTEEAFKMAQTHNQMAIYSEIVGDTGDVKDYRNMAETFEKSNNHFEAGRNWLRAGEFSRAINLLLKCTRGDGAHIELAIEAVGAARDVNLTHKVVDYLTGDSDGVPKEPKYLFNLYMALKQYKEAARTAIVISREEQNSGNYRNAHDVLFNMIQQLQQENIRVPAEMQQNLLLLHSYILVKVLVKRGDHLKGARMLCRVAANISKFPAHVVNILTSTVIECFRSGLKNSAFDYAVVLMNPDYRKQLDPKYKEKIEKIVRKPIKTEEPDIETPCPFCKTPVASCTLTCHNCSNSIPYCIASGKHLVADDWTECPECHFPALYSEFKEFLSTEESCPMCNKAVNAAKLAKLSDTTRTIKPVDNTVAPEEKEEESEVI